MDMTEAKAQWPHSIDLGDDHEYDFVYGSAEGWPETIPDLSRTTEMGKLEVVIGIMEWHYRPGGRQYCGGFVRFVRAHGDNSMDVWTVEELEPLTLSPALSCRACADEGSIRHGRWEAA